MLSKIIKISKINKIITQKYFKINKFKICTMIRCKKRQKSNRTSICYQKIVKFQHFKHILK